MAKTPSKPVALRAFRETDLDQIFSLYEQVFGADARDAFRARWQWSQVQNLFPENSPKWVLDSEGEIVGFLGTVPIPYVIAAKRVVTHCPGDYMVAKRAQFHGIKLMRECFRACPAIVSLDDVEATIAVSRFLKAKHVATMERWVKVLDPRMALRRWPELARVPSAAWQIARMGLSMVDVPKSFLGPIVQTLIGKFDERFDRFFDRCLSSDSKQACVDRSSRYLNWRYGEKSPNASRSVGFVASKRGDVEGYVVCGNSHDAEKTGFILELLVAPTAGDDVVNALVAFASKTLRRQGAWLMRWHLLQSDARRLQPILAHWGFSRRASQHQLLVYLNDGATAPPVADHVWRQQFGDAEASHGALY